MELTLIPFRNSVGMSDQHQGDSLEAEQGFELKHRMKFAVVEKKNGCKAYYAVVLASPITLGADSNTLPTRKIVK